MDIVAQTWEHHDADYWRNRWNAGLVRFYQSAGSTNDLAAQLADAGAPHLSIVVAEEQTAGRGRGGNAWKAPAGSSLLFSVVLRTPERAEAPGCAPIRVGLAVARAIGDAMIKWPNDIVMPGRGKVAGILCEGSFTTTGGYIVAGIGINVRQTLAQLEPSATSLLSAGRVAHRSALLDRVMHELHAVSTSIMNPLSDAEVDVVNQHDILRGREIICDSIRGTAAGITRMGLLRIEQPNGDVREVLNGTVRLANNEYPA